MKTIKGRYRTGRIAFAVLIAISGIVSSVFSQTDIEKNFTRANNIDLTGTYEVSGYLEDSSEYSGTLKLEKWNTFTTLRGGVLQSFKMTYTFGETKSAGVAVFDGTRLYYATGEGDGSKNNYYLLLLSKLELSSTASISLYEYVNANSQAKDGKYFEWKGDPPWYGYIDVECTGYGYWFWIDGIWGQYSTRKIDFPHIGDSAAFRMLELKKDGKFGKKERFMPKGYFEAGGFDVTPEGENLRIDVSWLSVGSSVKKKQTWGTGLIAIHPATGDSILVAMIGGPDNANVGYMDISGKRIVGVWASMGGDYQRSEEWEVPEAVILKNPAWFK